MRIGVLLCLAVLLTAGCQKSNVAKSMDLKTFDVEEAPPGLVATPPAGTPGIKVSIPQIAYTYTYRFSLPLAEIARTQKAHIALCDRLGFGRCRVIAMDRNSGAGFSSGTLKLELAAPLVRDFGLKLADKVRDAGGEEVGNAIVAEDLSKQLVDTQARLDAKILLAQRLTGLLRTRQGSVADLVAAESALADVQEQIDGARSWLAEARGRVAMSTVDVDYSVSGPLSGGFFDPIRKTFATMSDGLGQSIANLIYAIVVTLPWLLALTMLIFTLRRLKILRNPFRRRAGKSGAAPSDRHDE